MVQGEVLRPLKGRRLAFVLAYNTPGTECYQNGTKAAQKAGYSANGASIQAARLLRNATVQAEVAKHSVQIREASIVDAEWVVQKLQENLEQNMDAGRQGAVVNKAAELLAKILGIMQQEGQIQPVTINLQPNMLNVLSDEEARLALDTVARRMEQGQLESGE